MTTNPAAKEPLLREEIADSCFMNSELGRGSKNGREVTGFGFCILCSYKLIILWWRRWRLSATDRLAPPCWPEFVPPGYLITRRFCSYLAADFFVSHERSKVLMRVGSVAYVFAFKGPLRHWPAMDVAQNGSFSMDRDKIAQALKATTSSTDQAAAAVFLNEASQMVGFSPMMVHFLMDEHLNPSVRQAAVLYLKNLISQNWTQNDEDTPSFVLPEQDKQIIRQHIVDCIVASPEAIRVQLCTGVQHIMRADFPEQWPSVIDKVVSLLETTDGPSWLGALLVIHRLAKLYEYKRQKEKGPLIAAMQRLLPMMFQRLIALIDDVSQESCLLQKLILKTFFCLIQFSMNTDMFNIDSFNHWVEIFRRIIERPVPAEVDQLDDAEKTETVWWKCKKWALKIMNRIFDKYGSPGQTEPHGYTAFATAYLDNHAIPTVHTVLAVLHEKAVGNFVSEQVIYHGLSYLANAVSHSKTWKAIKPYITEMTSSLIFPLMRHDDDDEELWDENPEEFIRFKYDIFEDLHNPEAAAANFLQSASKRKDILPAILQFIVNVLSQSQDARDIDGALHIVGELAEALNRA
uniref:Importin N-terminal domain-containing protein n=1 Tax=Steinernema glaseri TaxID=37863 RepID=A0A1I8A6K9_9BILA